MYFNRFDIRVVFVTRRCSILPHSIVIFLLVNTKGAALGTTSKDSIRPQPKPDSKLSRLHLDELFGRENKLFRHGIGGGGEF